MDKSRRLHGKGDSSDAMLLCEVQILTRRLQTRFPVCDKETPVADGSQYCPAHGELAAAVRRLNGRKTLSTLDDLVTRAEMQTSVGREQGGAP